MVFPFLVIRLKSGMYIQIPQKKQIINADWLRWVGDDMLSIYIVEVPVLPDVMPSGPCNFPAPRYNFLCVIYTARAWVSRHLFDTEPKWLDVLVI